MSETVATVDLGVRWEPNAPEARLVVTDGGSAVLTLAAHFDDIDQRLVALRWTGTLLATMSAPNDEARQGHRLYDVGLAAVTWAGEVASSALIADLERQNSVHPRHDPAAFTGLRHWVLPLKECVVEVVAAEISVERTADG